MAKNKILEGRLKKDASRFTLSFSASHSFDRELYKEDIALSQAHIKMLHRTGALNRRELTKLSKALSEIQTMIANNKMKWYDEYEDIHMHIEAELTKKLGDLGKKLHLGRSRNDQVSTDLRLYIKRAIDSIGELCLKLGLKLAQKALREHHTLMPGFTHLQAAQPTTCGHHLMAWYEMLQRDYERFTDCRRRVDRMPLGSAALAGTSYPIDRRLLMKELNFAKIMDNSLDAVSSRDFVIEFLAAAAILMQHLSRWSEELILWNSHQFGFVTLDDEICTGSSIMPQKKNPDLAELVRGKSGRVIGNLNAMLVVMKAQALAYNKDNQEDKELLFDTTRTTKDCLNAWLLLIDGISFNREKMAAALELGFVNATRLADYLAAKKVPFRDAYKIAGTLVIKAQQQNKRLQDLSLADMQKESKHISEDIYPLLDYKNIVASYAHPGGSAPKQVKSAATKAIAATQRKLAALSKRV